MVNNGAVNMNIELTQEQVEAFNRGESITIMPEPKKWEPRKDLRYRSSAFSSRDTLEADNKVHKDMRTHNRLLAYVDEFGEGWSAVWEYLPAQKYYVGYDVARRKYYIGNTNHAKTFGTIYMSQECAQDLIAKLESGEVVL
jgi:hypothetical protein